MTRLDRILSGQKNTINSCPEVISKWDSYDNDLQEHYIIQIQEMFSSYFAQETVYKLAQEEGRLETVIDTWLKGMAAFEPYAAFFESKGAIFQ